MAGYAGGAAQIVVIVHVAVGAGARRHSVQAGEREPGAVVIELRVSPVAGAMALLASLGEARGDVVGIRGSLEILQVAADACRGVDRVVVVDVAIGTLPRRNGVHSREREVSKVVVERCIRPGASGVTLVACLREI